MKSNGRLVWLTGALFCVITAGCVSIHLGSSKPEKSQGVNFRPPGSPFEALANSKADGAWQNKSNGNSISYLSTCNDPADPSLEAVSQELFSGLTDMKVLHSETTSFNEREALDTEVVGELDGVTTHIQSVVFKKNNCLYTLSYIGVARSFAEDRGKFDDFKKSFEAP